MRFIMLRVHSRVKKRKIINYPEWLVQNIAITGLFKKSIALDSQARYSSFNLNGYVFGFTGKIGSNIGAVADFIEPIEIFG
jgi:hypothetical protein